MALAVSSVLVHIGAASPPAVLVAQTGVSVERGADEQKFKEVLTFLVPPNYYYKATSATEGAGVTCTLTKWYEWELF